MLFTSFAAIAAEPARVLEWRELIPEDPSPDLLKRKRPANALDGILSTAPPEPAAIVETLNGERVRVPGFVVPLESDEGGELTEFFLVPYYGACIHVPPPPANQIIYVKVQDKFFLESMMDPFWIEGVISTQSFSADLGEAGYTIVADEIEKYEY